MLQIYNSLTRKKEPFTPLDGKHVRMYVCGMTVYDYCHIGHARTVTIFDVVARYLRARGYDLTYVRNITDVDDKIIRRAAENGEDFQALAIALACHAHARCITCCLCLTSGTIISSQAAMKMAIPAVITLL